FGTTTTRDSTAASATSRRKPGWSSDTRRSTPSETGSLRRLDCVAQRFARLRGNRSRAYDSGATRTPVHAEPRHPEPQPETARTAEPVTPSHDAAPFAPAGTQPSAGSRQAKTPDRGRLLTGFA